MAARSKPVVQHIAAILDQQSELFWTPVSIAEIYAGVRKNEESRTANLFILMESIDITIAHGKKAGQYLRMYSKSHGVELGDSLIAACAFSEGLELWTLNKKHYPMNDVRFFIPQFQ